MTDDGSKNVIYNFFQIDLPFCIKYITLLVMLLSSLSLETEAFIKSRLNLIRVLFSSTYEKTSDVLT